MCRRITGLISFRTMLHRVLQFTSRYGIQGVECTIVHPWMGSTMYPTGGHEILELYLRGVDYFLRTSNFLAGRTVMSPLWDIITGQRLMMTRVARWML
jgi:hypothetical protein